MNPMSEQLPIKPFSDPVKDALKTLKAVFEEKGIAYCLIGALARDIQFYTRGIVATRRTEDIDFAVLVPNWQEYEAVMEALVAKAFTTTTHPYELQYANTSFDILPVGNIETGHEVHFKKSTLSVFGVQVMMRYGSFDTKVEDLTVPILSLESLFLLKLISFQDAWPDRYNDADDIWELLYNYWDIYYDDILYNHYELLDNEDFDSIDIGAVVLGRKLKPILSQTEEVREKVVGILSQEVSAEGGYLARSIAKKLESKDLEKARAYLNAVYSSI